MREDLFKVIQQYKTNADKDGSFKKLDKEAQRYVEKTLQDYHDSGMNLAPEERKKLIQLQKEISELEQKGEANINEDKSKIEFSVAELKGIP
jgi:Zn-dependent oligopeptidase